MATNQGNQGDQRQGTNDTSNRGFAGMDDDRQRDAASKGGQTSANEQRRDDQGQFAGTGGSSTRQGGSSTSQGGSSMNQGGSGQARDDQGQFTGGQNRSGSGGSNR